MVGFWPGPYSTVMGGVGKKGVGMNHRQGAGRGGRVSSTGGRGPAGWTPEGHVGWSRLFATSCLQVPCGSIEQTAPMAVLGME